MTTLLRAILCVVLVFVWGGCVRAQPVKHALQTTAFTDARTFVYVSDTNALNADALGELLGDVAMTDDFASTREAWGGLRTQSLRGPGGAHVFSSGFTLALGAVRTGSVPWLVQTGTTELGATQLRQQEGNAVRGRRNGFAELSLAEGRLRALVIEDQADRRLLIAPAHADAQLGEAALLNLRAPAESPAQEAARGDAGARTALVGLVDRLDRRAHAYVLFDERGPIEPGAGASPATAVWPFGAVGLALTNQQDHLRITFVAQHAEKPARTPATDRAHADTPPVPICPDRFGLFAEGATIAVAGPPDMPSLRFGAPLATLLPGLMREAGVEPMAVWAARSPGGTERIAARFADIEHAARALDSMFAQHIGDTSLDFQGAYPHAVRIAGREGGVGTIGAWVFVHASHTEHTPHEAHTTTSTHGVDAPADAPSGPTPGWVVVTSAPFAAQDAARAFDTRIHHAEPAEHVDVPSADAAVASPQPASAPTQAANTAKARGCPDGPHGFVIVRAQALTGLGGVAGALGGGEAGASRSWLTAALAHVDEVRWAWRENAEGELVGGGRVTLTRPKEPSTRE